MSNRLVWLHLAYWAGAIADALTCFFMLSGQYLHRFVPTAQEPTGGAYAFAMTFGAALMAGWTVLLLWADRRPIARPA